MADVIQANHEQLSAIAKRFQGSAQQIAEMHQRLRQRTGSLRRSWEGVAATAFFAEWESVMEPGIVRLHQALQQAGSTTQQMSKVLLEGEQAAARLFQSQAAAPIATMALKSEAAQSDGDDGSIIPQWLKDILEGGILGDFGDNSSLAGLIAQVAIGFIPIVGQIADIRDIIANIKGVLDGKEGAAVFLVISIVAIIPGLDALKAAKALKPIFKALGSQGIQEAVEFIARNPGEIARVGRTLGGLLDNPKLIQTLADNPQLASSLIRHGSPEAVEAIIKGGDDALVEIAQVGARYGDDGGYIVANYHRYQEFAAGDLAHVGKITPATLNESAVALGLEGRGLLTPPIGRSPVARADFVDSNGQLWDVKGFNSNFPPRQGGFDLNRSMTQIQSELGKGENVIIDTQNMSAQHIADLQQAVQNAGIGNQVLWFP